jgi:imidazolonepropionase-like amidohydrolase
MSTRRRTAPLLALALALASSAAIAQPANPKQPVAKQPVAKPPAAKPPVAPKAVAGEATAPAQAVLAIVGATLHTGTGEIIEDGTVIIAQGKIREIGKAIAAPAGAQVIAAKGMVITPGFTDALTSVGLVEIDLEDTTRDDHQGGKDQIRAGFRAADGYNPASSVIPVTRAEGVTSVGVIPVGGLISGQSAWADMDGATAADAIAAAPLALHVHLESGDEEQGGRATAILRVREAFDDARTFAKTRASWERNQSRPFAPSRLDLEALTRALGGKLPVVFHVDRAADILSALAVAKEFELKPVIAGGAEAWKVAATLAAAKVPVIVFPLVSGPDSFDSLGGRQDNAARLHAAGVPLILATGDTANTRKLRQVAGNAVRAGLPHSAAIAAITRAPAEALGLGARYGTLAAGKTANLVVWSGDPLEISTRVVQVVIRGQTVSLRTRQTALFEKYRRPLP